MDGPYNKTWRIVISNYRGERRREKPPARPRLECIEH